jgi:hypothetical protein
MKKTFVWMLFVLSLMMVGMATAQIQGTTCEDREYRNACSLAVSDSPDFCDDYYAYNSEMQKYVECNYTGTHVSNSYYCGMSFPCSLKQQETVPEFGTSAIIAVIAIAAIGAFLVVRKK